MRNGRHDQMTGANSQGNKMTFKSAFIAGMMFVTPAVATQLQGEQRTEAIKSSTGTCLANNLKKPENRDYTVAAVNAFCTCVGTGAADTFSIEELIAAGEKMTPDFIKRRAAFTQKCAASTLVKAKS
jgi:hypothetical protein